MKKAIAILAVLSLTAFAGQAAVDLGPVQGTDGDWLRYDDTTAFWYTWGGMYRGVWFNTEDFIPGFGGAGVLQSEIWFYHNVEERPWDTSDVYVELWNGDAMGPATQLDQTVVTAMSFSPVYATYAPGIIAEANFWLVANTEMSAGGWPSLLGDEGGVASVAHSFYSDDLIIWEPWTPPYGIANYLMAVEVDPLALDNSTWGSLKATF